MNNRYGKIYNAVEYSVILEKARQAEAARAEAALEAAAEEQARKARNAAYSARYAAEQAEEAERVTQYPLKSAPAVAAPVKAEAKIAVGPERISLPAYNLREHLKGAAPRAGAFGPVSEEAPRQEQTVEELATGLGCGAGAIAASLAELVEAGLVEAGTAKLTGKSALIDAGLLH
jgi:hypothetical protein